MINDTAPVMLQILIELSVSYLSNLICRIVHITTIHILLTIPVAGEFPNTVPWTECKSKLKDVVRVLNCLITVMTMESRAAIAGGPVGRRHVIEVVENHFEVTDSGVFLFFLPVQLVRGAYANPRNGNFPLIFYRFWGWRTICTEASPVFPRKW